MSEKHSRLKKEYLLILFATFLFGIAAHAPAMFQKLSFLDDPLYQFNAGGTVSSGRWALYFLYRFTRFVLGGAYSLPLFNSLLGFFFLAVSVVLLTELFAIRNKIFLVALSGIMVVTPAVTGLMAYQYTFHYYFAGLMSCVAGAYLIVKKKGAAYLIAGILFAAFGTGVYQAYFPFLAGIFLICVTLRLTEEEHVPVKTTLLFALRLIGAAVAVLLLYLLVNRLMLNAFQTTMTTYRGMDTFGKTDFSGYLGRVADAYIQFFAPLPDGTYNMYPMRSAWLFWLSVCLMLFVVILMLRDLWKTSATRAICFALCMALSPLVFNLMFVITGKEEMHALMVHAQVLWFFLLTALAERLKVHTRLILPVFAAVLLLLNAYLVRYANVCYLGASYLQAEAVQYFTTLATRMQSIPGYRDGMSVVYIGEYEKKTLTLPAYEEFDVIETFPYPKSAEELVNYYTWKLFMAQWCGYDPVTADPEPFLEREEVKAMPCYPDDGSIRIVDDMLLVKFQEPRHFNGIK